MDGGRVIPPPKDRDRMPAERRRQTDENGDERARPVLHIHVGRRRIDVWNLFRGTTVVLSIVGGVATCAGVVMATLGYRFVGHGDDIGTVVAQVDTLKTRTVMLESNQAAMLQTLEVLRDAKCVELTREQIALAQIDCSDVFERMRRNGNGGER